VEIANANKPVSETAPCMESEGRWMDHRAIPDDEHLNDVGGDRTAASGSI
jgi:hypothetical protein